MIRLILTDIDNTILPHGESRVSERTVSSFHRALDAGIHIGPASGRGIDWIPPFFGGDATCCSTCLATNGLQVYLDGRLIHEEHSARSALREAATILKEVPHAGLLCFKGGTPLLVTGEREDLAAVFPTYARVCVPVEDVPDFPIIKSNVFISSDDKTARELVARLNREVEGLDFDYALPGFSNIMPHGYNKGTGVCMLCDALGIDTSEAVVFGDAENDLPMFSVVPDCVAVANAQSSVRDAARWHIGPCDEDAVAQAVEALASCEWPFSS
ncbi:MAG: HAD family hydrolase [Atopobiaceae bacterium]|nr:Cof-type HAD-IIB family hydrolase [Olegusella sp.]NLH91678.1 HAD family phosphatase [Atopobium sp.]